MKVRIKNSELVRLSSLSNFKIVKFVQLGLDTPKYIAPIRADEYNECEVIDEPLFMLKVIQYGIKHETI